MSPKPFCGLQTSLSTRGKSCTAVSDRHRLFDSLFLCGEGRYTNRLGLLLFPLPVKSAYQHMWLENVVRPILGACRYVPVSSRASLGYCCWRFRRSHRIFHSHTLSQPDLLRLPT